MSPTFEELGKNDMFPKKTALIFLLVALTLSACNIGTPAPATATTAPTFTVVPATTTPVFTNTPAATFTPEGTPTITATPVKIPTVYNYTYLDSLKRSDSIVAFAFKGDVVMVPAGGYRIGVEGVSKETPLKFMVFEGVRDPAAVGPVLLEMFPEARSYYFAKLETESSAPKGFSSGLPKNFTYLGAPISSWSHEIAFADDFKREAIDVLALIKTAKENDRNAILTTSSTQISYLQATCNKVTKADIDAQLVPSWIRPDQDYLLQFDVAPKQKLLLNKLCLNGVKTAWGYKWTSTIGNYEQNQAHARRLAAAMLERLYSLQDDKGNPSKLHLIDNYLDKTTNFGRFYIGANKISGYAKPFDIWLGK